MAVFAVAIAGLLASPADVAFADAQAEVKKSQSGICHGQDSVHYERTEKFTAYDSMAECLASGGRESRAPRQASPWRWLLAAASMAVLGVLGWVWMRKRGPARGA